MMKCVLGLSYTYILKVGMSNCFGLVARCLPSAPIKPELPVASVRFRCFTGALLTAKSFRLEVWGNALQLEYCCYYMSSVY